MAGRSSPRWSAAEDAFLRTLPQESTIHPGYWLLLEGFAGRKAKYIRKRVVHLQSPAVVARQLPTSRPTRAAPPVLATVVRSSHQSPRASTGAVHLHWGDVEDIDMDTPEATPSNIDFTASASHVDSPADWHESAEEAWDEAAFDGEPMDEVEQQLSEAQSFPVAAHTDDLQIRFQDGMGFEDVLEIRDLWPQFFGELEGAAHVVRMAKRYMCLSKAVGLVAVEYTCGLTKTRCGAR